MARTSTVSGAAAQMRLPSRMIGSPFCLRRTGVKAHEQRGAARTEQRSTHTVSTMMAELSPASGQRQFDLREAGSGPGAGASSSYPISIVPPTK